MRACLFFGRVENTIFTIVMIISPSGETFDQTSDYTNYIPVLMQRIKKALVSYDIRVSFGRWQKFINSNYVCDILKITFVHGVATERINSYIDGLSFAPE